MTRTICFNSDPVEIVSAFKTLSVSFTSKRLWDAHISHVGFSTSRVTCLLYRYRHILPVEVKLLLLNLCSCPTYITANSYVTHPRLLTLGYLTVCKEKLFD